MNKVKVSIEIEGKQTEAGFISGQDGRYRFCYSAGYLRRPGAASISKSMPLQEEPFSSVITENFFDGLLPEGFTRRAVAGWLHEDDADYLTILSALGSECLGAIQIHPVDDDKMSSDRQGPAYKKLTLDQVRELAREGATVSAKLVTRAHISLTGATGKAGLYLDPESGDWYLPVGTAPSTHIVKQSHVRLKSIVANEQLTQLTASLLGIDTPESFIINLGDGADSEVLLATRRYDRVIDERSQVLAGLKIPFRLHQEDFSQALGIPASRKYEKENRREDGYLPMMFSLIRNEFRNPLEDQLKLWDRIIFCFLTGNTDSHLKNFSMLYSKDLQSVKLAPQYDLVSTAVYDSSTREMSFFIGDEITLGKIRRESFSKEAEYCGISKSLAMRRLDKMAGKFENALEEAAERLAEEGIPGTGQMRERILEHGGYRNIS